MKKLTIALSVVASAAAGFAVYNAFNYFDIIERAKQCFRKPVAKVQAHQQQALADDYVTWFDSLFPAGNTPGCAIAIVSDSTVLYKGGYGYTNIRTKQKVDTNTLFRIGSVSKTFAPVIWGMLVNEGKLGWNSKVSECLPFFKMKTDAATQGLSLGNTMSHSVGLPAHTYTTLVEDGLPLKKIVSNFQQVRVLAKPGAVYNYQNAAYSIIAQVMADSLHEDYGVYLQKHIFAPLGMSHASTDYLSIKYSGNYAEPHRWDGRKWNPRPLNMKYYNAVPAGGVNASIADMSHWLRAAMGYSKVVPQAILDSVQKPRIASMQLKKYFSRWEFAQKDYYGYGWRIVVCDGDTIIHHSGSVNGYRAEMAFSKKYHIGMCILSSSITQFAASAIPEFFRRLYFRQAQLDSSRAMYLQESQQKDRQACAPDLIGRREDHFC